MRDWTPFFITESINTTCSISSSIVEIIAVCRSYSRVVFKPFVYSPHDKTIPHHLCQIGSSVVTYGLGTKVMFSHVGGDLRKIGFFSS